MFPFFPVHFFICLINFYASYVQLSSETPSVLLNLLYLVGEVGHSLKGSWVPSQFILEWDPITCLILTI